VGSSGRERIVVGVVGDRHEGFAPQDSIEPALRHSADAIGNAVEVNWFPTARLADGVDGLQSVDAVWCAPGSPYVSMEGALSAIRFARESSLSFLGTCAGFQHGVLEYARNVLGIGDAQHAEYRADGPGPLIIDELLCSLVGRTMHVRLVDETAHAIYGSDRATEEYYCRFGLNERYRPALAAAGLVAAGVDASDGTTRIMRAARHPFFFLTLFVPQTSSAPHRPHPLITSYLTAAAERARSCGPGSGLRARLSG
jgi:CTP synthase (UTP-ammonia lyase)